MKMKNVALAAFMSALILLTGCGKNPVISDASGSSKGSSDSTAEGETLNESGAAENSDDTVNGAVTDKNGSTTTGVDANGRTTTKRVTRTRATKTDIILEGAGKDPDANYKVKGDVTVAVSSYRPADYEAMFDALSSVYPNVNITLDYRPRQGADSEETSNYLASRALAGNMPDVVFDDAGIIPNYLTQGWMYPLDGFVKNDANFNTIPASLKADYTYGGKLYALPHQAHFSAVVLNLDVMDDLNLDMPSLSWDMDEFEAFLKAGTTRKYSGLEYLGSLDTYTAGAYNKNVSQFGYNTATKGFTMAGSYSSALKFTRKLRAYPGLEAYQLRFTNSSAGVTDYVSKFGSGNTGVTDMAFKLGRTLVHLDQGTWGIDNLNSICKFEYMLFPYPQSKTAPGRIPIHVDHCFMTSSTKNAEAAFQVLRYMTYSTEGNLARLCMYDANNKGKYALNSRLYYPTVAQADVVNKFKSLPGVTSVDKFFLDNIGKGYRVDLLKLIPGWTDIHKALATNLEGKDNVDVDSLVAGLDAQANTLVAGQWSTFNSKLSAVQAQFNQTH